MSDEPTTVQTIARRVKIRSSHSHYEGTNDYSKHGVTIVEIIDGSGRKLQPVWESSWTNVAFGIATRSERHRQTLRISPRACPVLVKFRSWSEYVSYTDVEHCSQNESYAWVRYEADARSVLSVISRLFARVR